MATTEELIARIEHLEKVVYDELEYPKISEAREPGNIQKRYRENGIAVLKQPQPADIDLKFDEIFYDDMECGRKTVTFRRRQHGFEGDLFCVNGIYYELQNIEKMTLRTFIILYWDRDGFDCQDDAVEFFDNLYFPDWHDAWPTDYNSFYGYMHTFRKVK